MGAATLKRTGNSFLRNDEDFEMCPVLDFILICRNPTIVWATELL